MTISNRQHPVGNNAVNLAISLCIVFLSLAGCGKNSNSGPAAPAPATTSVSSSAQVVKVSTSALSISANGSADATVTLSISPGFHINANPATFPYLIATEVEATLPNGITAGKPVYPAAVKKTFQFAEQPLAVYEGQVSLQLPLRAGEQAKKGVQSLPIKLRVQACDEEKCYAPVVLDSSIPVTVK